MTSFLGTFDSTSSSLLDRVRARDAVAWQRLSDVYGPLVYYWCRTGGLSPEDSADVVQEVFRSVATGIDAFRIDRPGDSFRGWLRVIARNKMHDWFRRRKGEVVAAGGSTAHDRLQEVPDDLLDAESSPETEGQGIVRRAMELIRLEFEEGTWQAFWQTTVEGRSPADVATALGLSKLSVYQAKSRVLKRVRRELEGLGEDEGSK